MKKKSLIIGTILVVFLFFSGGPLALSLLDYYITKTVVYKMAASVVSNYSYDDDGKPYFNYLNYDARDVAYSEYEKQNPKVSIYTTDIRDLLREAVLAEIIKPEVLLSFYERNVEKFISEMHTVASNGGISEESFGKMLLSCRKEALKFYHYLSFALNQEAKETLIKINASLIGAEEETAKAESIYDELAEQFNQKWPKGKDKVIDSEAGKEYFGEQQKILEAKLRYDLARKTEKEIVRNLLNLVEGNKVPMPAVSLEGFHGPEYVIQ